jgi:hypothetical protein
VAIIAKASEGQNYAPAPEGTHQAVCVDVIDKGMVESSFLDGNGNKKMQHKIEIVWQIDELRDDGKRFQLYKRYTLSLNEKATLRHDLESWRGKPFTRDEEMGFDVETVIGANCLINVQHKPGTKDPNKVFANVVSIMPLLKGMKKIAADGYTRPAAAAPEPPPPTDEDMDDAREYPETAGEELMADDIAF